MGSSFTSTWPGLHELGIVREYGNDSARHLGGDRHFIAVHIGIVGFLALREHQNPIRRAQRANADEDQRNDKKNPAPLAIARDWQSKIRCSRSWCRRR